MKTRIIYEDKDVIVIAKPAGLATQTARAGEADVVSELKNYLARQGPPYLGIIHRLDQPVEGLLVFAKNKRAAAALTKQLNDRESGCFHKRYYAAVYGEPPEDEGTLTNFMYKDENGRAVIVEEEQGNEGAQAKKTQGAGKRPAIKKAVLRYRRVATVRDLSGESFSMMEIFLETGRFHQIRAQMAHMGLPLLGDVKYGNEASTALSRSLGLKNAALCAYRLEFRHPVSEERKCFQIEPEGEIFLRFAMP